MESISSLTRNDEELRVRLTGLCALMRRCGRPWAKTFTAGVLATSGSESLFSSLKNLIGMKETSLMSFLQSSEHCLQKAIYRQIEIHLQQESLIAANYQALFQVQR